jgi:hypothetical protein
MDGGSTGLAVLSAEEVSFMGNSSFAAESIIKHNCPCECALLLTVGVAVVHNHGVQPS